MLATTLSVLWLAGLGLLCLLGLLLVAVQAPGTWLILLAAAGYGWHEGFTHFSTLILGILLGLALFAELLEFLPSLELAKRAGASRRAAWIGLLGGVIGMFALTVPVPIVGTIVGGVIGCFAGAVIGELTLHDDVDQAAKVGLAAAVGRVVGLVAKLCVAFAMIGVCVFAVFH